MVERIICGCWGNREGTLGRLGKESVDAWQLTRVCSGGSGICFEAWGRWPDWEGEGAPLQ